MPKNIEQMVKKFEEVKNLIAKMEDQFKNQKVEADAGAGLVKIIANGNQEILEVHIDPELIRLKDQKLLEDLIKSAVNQVKQEAMKASQELVKKAMKFDTNGLKNLLSD